MTTKCPVVHFEMPYDDAKGVSAFYERVFGWAMTPLGSESNHYVLAETTDAQNGRPTHPGHINGGLFPGNPKRPVQAPNFGRYVAFEDREGYPAAMLQPER